MLSRPGVKITWKSDNDVSLLDHNGHGKRLLLVDAESVQYARFRYRLTPIMPSGKPSGQR